MSQSVNINNETYVEKFELEQFPFDLQKCSVILTIESGCPVIPIEGEVFVRSELPEWDMFNPQITYEQFANGKKLEKPVMVYSLILRRKSNWFVINHMAMMGLIASLCFSAFAVEVDSFADRASITLALLLTIVAQKLSLVDNLPLLSYLTFIDVYILSCFGLTIVITLVAFIMKMLVNYDYSFEDVTIYDFWVSVALLALWVIWHVYILSKIKRRTD